MAGARAARDNATTLEEIHREAEKRCDPETVRRIGAALAAALYRVASSREQGQAEQTLSKALNYARHWQILAALGEIYSAQRNWQKAAIRFQEALVEIGALPEESLPPKDIIASLLRKANNSRAAAPVYVRALRTRGNQPGGIASEQIGGLEIESVPFPIEFVFGEAAMTEKGVIAALDLVDILKAQTPPRVTLVGHTDPVGPDAFNDRLSLARAEAVRDFLLAHDVAKVTILVEGRGERQPPEIDDRSLFSLDELHQIARRVELVRR